MDAIRHFNRFYTHKMGLLRPAYLDSGHSLTEVRVLYELAHRPSILAADLVRDLGLDPGYVSRIIAAFIRRGIVARKAAKEDARCQHLSLTKKGRSVFSPLEVKARREIDAMLRPLTQRDRRKLIASMRVIESLLGKPNAAPEYIVRPHQPGDMGWVVQRHGALYAQEYGWDITFEALVADIAAKFIRDFDPAWEGSWIAARHEEILGSVFVVRKSKQVAQLRMLIVDPAARGMGIGHRLVGECVAFAKQRGYRKMMLWTVDILTAARKIYQHYGFRLVTSTPNHEFGRDLVDQTWELDLRRL